MRILGSGGLGGSVARVATGTPRWVGQVSPAACGLKLDEAKMTEAVDAELYRNRKDKLAKG